MNDPRTIVAPFDIEDAFISQAEPNTEQGIETCGLLCGRINDTGPIRITHLIIPPQVGTSNTVDMQGNLLVGMYLINENLQTVGWIHTHPSQTAFLSSVDMHTQHSYQAQCPEAVAEVCAPSYNSTKWFRLTALGMTIISDCTMRGFHDHATRRRLVGAALNTTFSDACIRIVDLRGRMPPQPVLAASSEDRIFSSSSGSPQKLVSKDDCTSAPAADQEMLGDPCSAELGLCKQPQLEAASLPRPQQPTVKEILRQKLVVVEAN